jgi:hypothetical protein
VNRRTTLNLTGMALVGLAMAGLPQLGFGQSSPLIGTWQLNLAKSKFSGPAPRSLILNYTQDGQNIRNTVQSIDAQGNPRTTVLMHVYDGQPHPSTGSPDYDASAYTRTDANTVIFNRLKAGKLVAIGTGVVSQDGNTFTVTETDIDGTDIEVYDKQ